MLATAAIYDLCADLLASMVTYIGTPVSGGGPGLTVPERSFVANGSVAWDTEQLYVRPDRLYFGTATDESLKLVKIPASRTIVIEVGVLICVPSIPESDIYPTAEAIDNSAAETLPWAVALGNAIINASKTGVFDACQDVAIGASLPQGPDGALAGWSQELRIQL